MKHLWSRSVVACACLGLSAAGALAVPVGTGITYQGLLRSGGSPYNGNAAMVFQLWDAAAGGAQVGANDVEAVVVVSSGLFNVTLNDANQFGAAAFAGDARWLAIIVNGNLLTPRQPVTLAPHALFAVNAANATSAGNANTFDGLNSPDFLRSNTSDTFTSGTLTIAGAATLDVAGALQAVSLIDRNNATYLVDPSNVTTSANLAGSIEMQTGESINVDGQLTVGGTNLRLRLGDSTADQVSVPAKEFFMSDTVTPADGNQNLWFTDGAVTTANFIRWDDVTTFACGGALGDLDSAFDFHIADDANSGWVFTTGASSTDAEVRFDDDGNFQADGTIVSTIACDLAEAFLGPEGLPAGSIVVLDAARPEAVVLSSSAYQGGLVGVISTRPSFIMGGPTADAYPLIEQWEAAEAAAAMTGTERALMAELESLRVNGENDADGAVANRKAEITVALRQEWAARAPAVAAAEELEREFDSWTRGNVHVALAGRVPVRVIGPVNPGDHLTASAVPGVAMAMNASGPTVGIALSAFNGSGQGSVVTLIQPGWYGGFGGGSTTSAAPADLANLRAENADLRARLDAIEGLLVEQGLLAGESATR